MKNLQAYRLAFRQGGPTRRTYTVLKRLRLAPADPTHDSFLQETHLWWAAAPLPDAVAANSYHSRSRRLLRGTWHFFKSPPQRRMSRP